MYTVQHAAIAISMRKPQTKSAQSFVISMIPWETTFIVVPRTEANLLEDLAMFMMFWFI